MPKKLDYNTVKKNIESKGFTLLSDDYINNKNPLKIICKYCNSETYQRYDRLMMGYGCGCRHNFSVINKNRFITLNRFVCKYCENIFYSQRNKQKFCDIKCAKNWRRYTLEGIKQCKKGGLNSYKISKNNKRSKNEIELSRLCIKHFGESETLTNYKIFSGFDADVILENFKLAIEWNGVWHYKYIRRDQKLKKILHNDKLKAGIIRSHNYNLIVVKDMGSHNIKLVRKTFNVILNLLNTNMLKSVKSNEIIQIDANTQKYEILTVRIIDHKVFEQKRKSKYNL
jgi:hypothetical protein